MIQGVQKIADSQMQFYSASLLRMITTEVVQYRELTGHIFRVLDSRIVFLVPVKRNISEIFCSLNIF